MAKCNDITVVKVDYEKRPNEKEKKQSIYQPTIITDEVVTNLFSDPKSNNKQFSELFTNEDAMLGKENFKSVHDKTKSLQHFEKNNKPFGEKIGVITDGRDIRDISIAISQLISAKKSELDLTDKYNLNPRQIEQVESKFGTIQTSFSNMARNIGREILKSRGYRIVPKNENGIKQELQYEIQLGEEALRKLPKEILDIRTDGSIINRDFRNPDPKNEFDVKYSPNKVLQNVKTISFGSIIKEETDGKLTEADETDNFRIMSKLAATIALLVPSNQAIPFDEAQSIDEAHQDIRMTENSNQTLEQFQRNPLVMDGFFKDALGELRDMVLKEDKSTTKNSMIALANWVFNHPEAKNIFGTINQEELSEIMMGDPTGIEQAYGQSNSIVLQFNRIFDSWDKVQDEIFYTYQTAIQNRAHTIPQTLNYQTDKVVSRPILVTKDIQTLSDAGTRYMMAFIEDETGLNIEEMLVHGKKAELDKYIDAIDNGVDSPLDIMLALSKDMDKDAHPIGSKVKSAWEAMSYVIAIKDLRDGIHNGNPVKTRFMPSPDATASGAVITVSQAARYGGTSAEIYKKLVSGELKDVYDLSLVKLDEFLDNKNQKKGIGSMSAAKAKTAELMQSLIDNGVVKDTRELIKYPFIKYTYGQFDFNNRLEVAKEIAKDIIDVNNIQAMKSLLKTDDNGKSIEILPDNTTDRREFLIKRLSESNGVTDTLVKMVASSIGEDVFGEQKKDLTTIYSLLEESTYADGSLYKTIEIIPTLAWLDTTWDLAKGGIAYEKYREDYSAPLEKYFEAIIETGEGEVTTIKKRYPNVTSILVLLQHMADAAIAYRSNSNMFKSKKHKDYTGGLKLLHDSIAGEVEYAMDLEPEYRKESTFVNSNYDFVEAALAELKFARSKIFADQGEINSQVEIINAQVSDMDSQLIKLWEDIKANREQFNNYDVENTPIEKIQSTDTQEAIDMRHEMGVLHAERQYTKEKLDMLSKIKPNPEFAAKLDETIAEFDAKLPAQIATKKEVLSEDIPTAFGVKPHLIKKYNEADINSYKTKETKQNTEKEIKLENLSADDILADLNTMIEKNPDSVLTYDLETDSLDKKTANLRQIGYKVGTNKANTINIQFTGETEKDRDAQAKEYLDFFLGSEQGKKDIRASDLYKSIQRSFRERNGMATWNKKAVPLVDALEQFEAVSDKAEAIISFNGTKYDDAVMEAHGVQVKTTHDMRNLSKDSVLALNREGKLAELSKVKVDNLHSADVDVELTFEAALEGRKKKVTSAGIIPTNDLLEFRTGLRKALHEAENFQDLERELGGEHTVNSLSPEHQLILQSEIDIYVDELPNPDKNIMRTIKEPQTHITKKAKAIIDKKLDFSEKEMKMLEKRFGKNNLDRMFTSIFDNINSIDVLADDNLSSVMTMFIDDRVKIGTAPIDVREMKSDLTGMNDLSLEEQQESLLSLLNELNKKAGFKEKLSFLEILSHELDHKTSAVYVLEYIKARDLGKNLHKYQDLVYIENTIKNLRETLKDRFQDNFRIDGTAKDSRLHYALYGAQYDPKINSEVDLVSMLEFMAIMRNEPKYANTLLSKAYPNKSKSFISKVVKELLEIIEKIVIVLIKDRKAITNRNIKTLDTLFKGMKSTQSKETLKAALDISYIKGNNRDNESSIGIFGNVEARIINVVTDNYKPYNPKIEKSTGIDKQASNIMTDLDKKAANVIKYTIDLSIDHTVKLSYVSDQHEHMMKTSQIYRDTFNAVTDQWENNTFIGKVKFYLDLDDNARRKEFNILNTQSTTAEERKAQFESDKMNSLYKQMRKANFQKSETELLYTLLSEVPIANLAPNGIALDIFKGKLSIEDAIQMVLDGSELNTAQKRKYDAKAKELAAYYIDKTAPKNFTTDKHLDSTSRAFVGQLSALYSMQKVPNINNLITKIMSSQDRKAVVTEMLRLASATKVLDEELDGTITYQLDKHNGNLNYQIFNNNVELKRVSKKTIDKELQKDLGWKVLEHPTEEVAGILYRDAGDLTYQSGIGTQTKLQPNLNLVIPDTYAISKNNSVPMINGSGSRIILTNEQLKTIGLVQDPVAALVKSYSHRMMLQETQSIREVLVNEFSYNMVDNTEAEIIKDIKAGKHNWYIQLPKGMTLSKMDPLIQKKYKLSRSRSDANNFSKKMTLIRSDMSDFVEGYGEIQIGEVGTKLNKAFSILKKAVLMQKIHWVITNPIKIGMDAVSNTAYLLSRNIPITTIYEKTKTISQDMVTLTNLRENLLHAEFRNRANPSKAAAHRIEVLENKIKNHRLASAYFRGFISSIAIDLTQKNEHTSTGIHKDITVILDKIFKNDDESLNRAGKAIMSMSKGIVNGEDLLIKVSNLISKREEGKKREKGTVSGSIADTLEGIANNIKTMKNEDDIAGYLQEYMMTPGSSGVTLGSALVQAPDVIAKVILQEFLVEQKIRNYRKENKGRSPNKADILKINEDASLEAVQSFIDYKMNIPRELRFLEQTGVTSFISFWSRIQKVMLTSLRNHPVNAMTTIILNELLLDGDSGATIFDSSVIDKWGSGSLLGGPNLGLDVLLPMKIAG